MKQTPVNDITGRLDGRVRGKRKNEHFVNFIFAQHRLKV